MNMKRMALKVVFAAVALLAATVGFTVPATAAATCAANSVCVWDGANQTGAKATISYNLTPSCVNLSRFSFDNRTSSAWVTTSHKWAVYLNANCTGAYNVFHERTKGNMAGTWNNSISSIRYCPGIDCP